MAKILFRDTGTVVIEDEMVPFPVLIAALDSDGGALSGVCYRIVNQVAEYGLDEMAVAAHESSGADQNEQLHLLLLQLCSCISGKFLQHFLDVQSLHLERCAGLFDSGQCGDVVRQPAEPFALRAAALQKSLHCLPVHVRIVQNGFNISSDAADRCPELVGGILGQLPLEPGLVVLAVLKLGVQMHYLGGNATQLVVREGDVGIADVLTGCGQSSEFSQVGDIEADASDMAIEDEEEYD